MVDGNSGHYRGREHQYRGILIRLNTPLDGGFTGPPGEAVSMDTWQVLLETRLRAILTAIITADAPTGITLTDLSIDAPMTLKLEYMVGGSAAELTLDLSTLFPMTT